MLNIDDSVLIVVDVQARFSGMMVGEASLYHNIERLIKAVKVLQVPILWTEQAPDKLGLTVKSIQDLLLPLSAPIAKRSFSCWGSKEFIEALKKTSRKQVIVIGIETHVCIYQTASDLNRHGYEVFVAADATSARNQFNKDVTLDRFRQEKVIVTCSESVICELLRTADHSQFKNVMSYIK